MFALLFAVSVLAEVTGPSDSVYVSVRSVPSDIRWGDVVFMEVSVRNRGDQAVEVPAGCYVRTATLRVELLDPEEATRFYFLWDCCEGAGDSRKELLEPGQVRVLALQMVEVPRLDWTRWRFWDPKQWRPDDYRFDVRCSGLPASATPHIKIDRRPEKELDALLEYYDGGPHAPVPDDWDIDRPSLGIFGLLSFPPIGSMPDELARIEQELTPGSLREIVHAARLTARMYDAEVLEEKRGAADALFEWLDAQHEIARHWMTMQLVSWSFGNKGLGEYRFEFVDGLIPRLPEECGGQRWQENFRKENESSRQRYLEYMKARKQPSQPSRPGDAEAESKAEGQAATSGDATPRLTASNARLIGNIRAAGGRVWLPGRGWRPWEPRPGIAGVGVWLPGKIATRQMLAAIAKLGDVEYLAIEGPEAADESLTGLGSLPGLRELVLRDTRVSDAALRHLRGLRELESVELGHDDNEASRITGEGLVNLQALPKLRRLYLTKTEVKDAELKHLSSMTGLSGLWLGSTKITSQGLKHIAPLRQLRALSLRDTQVDDSGLDNLQGLTQLQSLSLDYTKVTDRGLAHVARFRELEDLGLSGNHSVTDEGLQHLKQLKRLRKFTINDCPGVADKGLEHLQGLTELRFLGLSHTEISDAGLKYLEGMKNLEHLYIVGTNVTGEGIAGLQQVLPEVEISQ